MTFFKTNDPKPKRRFDVSKYDDISKIERLMKEKTGYHIGSAVIIVFSIIICNIVISSSIIVAIIIALLLLIPINCLY